MTIIGTVAQLNRYPVKSMQGESPSSVELTTDGIVGDRTWALHDAETGKLVSAKLPRLWAGALECTASIIDGEVRVTVPTGETFGITDPGLRVSLSALFGREIGVEEWERPQQGSYASDWPDIEGLTLSGEIDFAANLFGEGAGFVDVGILHLLTTSSLQALAAAAPDVTVDARRFRPSILLDTAATVAGFIENDWEARTLTIGDPDSGDGVVISVGSFAPRCIMTTLAQPASDAGPAIGADTGVLRALAAHNRVTHEMGTYACLGVYASVAQPGTIRVGHTITID